MSNATKILDEVKGALTSSLGARLTARAPDYGLTVGYTVPAFKSIHLWAIEHSPEDPWAVVRFGRKRTRVAMDFSMQRHLWTLEVLYHVEEHNTADLSRRVILYGDAIEDVLKGLWGFYGNYNPPPSTNVEYIEWDSLETVYNDDETGIYYQGGLVRVDVRRLEQAAIRPW